MRKGTLSNPTGYHLRESVFRSYEDWLLRLVACYPEPLVITPTSHSPRTFACGLRDAANSFIQNRWASPLPYDEFCAKWKGCCVRDTSTQVVVAPPFIPVSQAIGTDAVALATPKFLMTLDSPSLVQLNAVAQLYTSGVTMQPTCIKGDVPAGFEVPSGVGLYPQEDGSYLLL